MRQLLALVLCWVTLPTFADSFAQGSENFSIRLVGNDFRGDRNDPASYLIVPPGRVDATTMVVEVQGLVDDGDGACRLAEKQLVQQGSSKPVTLAMRAGARRLWLTLGGLEVDLLSPQLARQLIGDYLKKPEVVSFFRCLKLGAVEELILHEVDQALARSFSGSLAHEFDLSPDHFSIDVKAGMRLCLRSVQTTFRKVPLVGQGNSECISVQQVRDPKTGAPVLSFDPFLANFKGLEVRSDDVGPWKVVDGADLADLARQRRYFKLFYPPAIDRRGYNLADHANPVYLVGVNSLEAKSCSERCGYSGMQPFCGAKTDVEQVSCPAECLQTLESVCYVFQEKAVPSPEIQVWLRGEPVWVPVGTTLLDVADRLGNTLSARPAEIPGMNSQAASCRLLHALKVKRLHDTRFVDVEFEDCGAGALYLPLLAGDQISW